MARKRKKIDKLAKFDLTSPCFSSAFDLSQLNTSTLNHIIDYHQKLYAKLRKCLNTWLPSVLLNEVTFYLGPAVPLPFEENYVESFPDNFINDFLKFLNGRKKEYQTLELIKILQFHFGQKREHSPVIALNEGIISLSFTVTNDFPHMIINAYKGNQCYLEFVHLRKKDITFVFLSFLDSKKHKLTKTSKDFTLRLIRGRFEKCFKRFVDVIIYCADRSDEVFLERLTNIENTIHTIRQKRENHKGGGSRELMKELSEEVNCLVDFCV